MTKSMRGTGVRTMGMRIVLCAVSSVGMLQTSCVTEEQSSPSRGVMIQPGSRTTTLANRNGARSNVTLPTGPVAKPADTQSINTSVRVEVLPIGTVEYDGSVLPIVSPNGKFIAVRQGVAADWDTLGATPDASTQFDSSITIYEINSSEPSTGRPTLVPIDAGVGRPEGLLLGRSSTDEGFLVALQQPDGTRWIGLCNWATGKVDWLVTSEHVNAHAVFTIDGYLVFTRRPIDANVGASLVMRTIAGEHRGSEDVLKPPRGSSFAMPMTTADDTMVYAMLVSDTLEMVGVSRVRRGSSADDRLKLGRVVSRKTMSKRASLVYAYIAGVVGSAAVPEPAHNDTPPTGFDSQPMVLHTGLSRLALYDAQRARFSMFPSGAQAGARIHQPGVHGYLLTTPKGLVYVPNVAITSAIRQGRNASPTYARVLEEAVVVRSTRDPEHPFILIGPNRRDPSSLTISIMAVVP